MWSVLYLNFKCTWVYSVIERAHQTSHKEQHHTNLYDYNARSSGTVFIQTRHRSILGGALWGHNFGLTHTRWVKSVAESVRNRKSYCNHRMGASSKLSLEVWRKNAWGASPGGDGVRSSQESPFSVTDKMIRERRCLNLLCPATKSFRCFKMNCEETRNFYKFL